MNNIYWSQNELVSNIYSMDWLQKGLVKNMHCGLDPKWNSHKIKSVDWSKNLKMSTGHKIE